MMTGILGRLPQGVERNRLPIESSDSSRRISMKNRFPWPPREGKKACLLEAGPADWHPWLHVPAGSTAINGLDYDRRQPEDDHGWAALGIPGNPDYNGATQAGAGYYPRNVFDGCCMGAVRAPGHPGRVSIQPLPCVGQQRDDELLAAICAATRMVAEKGVDMLLAAAR